MLAFLVGWENVKPSWLHSVNLGKGLGFVLLANRKNPNTAATSDAPKVAAGVPPDIRHIRDIRASRLLFWKNDFRMWHDLPLEVYMADTSPSARPSTLQLILVPSIITLGITILRLVGELQHWPKPWFSTTAGGGLAIIGISWLPLVFGPYFALKLAGKGEGPASAGRSIAFPVVGLLILIAGGYVSITAAQAQNTSKVLLGFLIMTIASALCFPGWSALSKSLLAYGLAARIPVAILMFFALRGNWETHYDALPPNYNGPTDLWPKYFVIGVIPQMLLWVPFTIVIGSLVGAIVRAIAPRDKPAMQTVS